MLRTGEPVRLKEHEQAAEFAAAGGFECGANFGGVMAVVVDDGDVVDHAFDVEAAADSGEFREAFANQLGWNAEVKGHGGGSGGVATVVDARRMGKLEGAEIFAFVG